MRCFFILPVILMLNVTVLQAQNKQSIFKDSTDHAFDLSDWLISAHGFVPMMSIITEPALGNFGVVAAPIFMHPKRRYLSDTSIHGKPRYVPPDITAAFALYTANGTWGVGGGRNGSWLRQRIRYRVGGGYFNLNMAFYRNSDLFGEQKFTFNFKAVPFYAHAIRQIQHSNWYVGIQYLFIHSEMKLKDEGNLPDFVQDKEINTTMSMPGVILEFDGRNNFFTPDKGLRLQASTRFSYDFFGSDFDYTYLNTFAYYYFPVATPKLIGGLRFDYQQMFGAPPFYMVSYINLRGIPVMRYQGMTTLVAEGEARWDLYKRWSAVFFAGGGNAFNDWDKMDDGQWAYSGGVGFRYLIARKFKLRMGADVARGPEQWAYYLVFGSAWLK